MYRTISTRPNTFAGRLRSALSCPAARRTCALCLLALSLSGYPAGASLLLTEIHYNGPAPGSDPDEFVELSNDGPSRISLDGLGFSAGIGFAFGAGDSLDPGRSLVIARDGAAFLAVFPAYRGPLYDYTGALSNSGELLQLTDGPGIALWSVTYDDGGAWPASADGGGDSLQLRRGGDFHDPQDWFAAVPTPGAWEFGGRSGADVAAPSPLPLMPLACWWLLRRRGQRSAQGAAPIPRRSRSTVAAS